MLLFTPLKAWCCCCLKGEEGMRLGAALIEIPLVLLDPFGDWDIDGLGDIVLGLWGLFIMGVIGLTSTLLSAAISSPVT